MNADRALRLADYLTQMHEAAMRIQKYVRGLSQAEFASNTLIQDAVIRNFEVIGEAARNIEAFDPSFAQRNPQVALTAALP